MLSMTFGRPSALLSQTVGLDEPLAYDLDAIGRMPASTSLEKAPGTPSTVSLFVYTMYDLAL